MFAPLKSIAAKLHTIFVFVKFFLAKEVASLSKGKLIQLSIVWTVHFFDGFQFSLQL